MAPCFVDPTASCSRLPFLVHRMPVTSVYALKSCLQKGFGSLQTLAAAGDRMPLFSQPPLPQKLPSGLSRLSPNTAVGSCSMPSRRSAREKDGEHAALADIGAENASASAQRREVEVCTTGAGTSLDCDHPPTPLEASGSNNPLIAVPGRVPSARNDGRRSRLS